MLMFNLDFVVKISTQMAIVSLDLQATLAEIQIDCACQNGLVCNVYVMFSCLALNSRCFTWRSRKCIENQRDQLDSI